MATFKNTISGIGNFLNPFNTQKFLGGLTAPASLNTQAQRKATGDPLFPAFASLARSNPSLGGTTTPQINQSVTQTSPAAGVVTGGSVGGVTVRNDGGNVGGMTRGATGGATGINTGNPQLDAFLQNIPQIQQALGIGVESPEQKTAREQQQGTLNRLLSLQEQMLTAGAPSKDITDLDKLIQEQTQALRSATPEELFRTTPQFQGAGITQGQLLRESAAKRAPIAQTLSDLLTSKSIFGEELKRQQDFAASQFEGMGNILGLQQAFQALQPQTGLSDEMKGSIFSGLTSQALQDPLDRKIKQAQLAKLQAETGGAGLSKLSAAQQEDLGTFSTIKQLSEQALTLGQQTNWAGTGGFKLGSLKASLAKNLGVGSQEAENLRNLVGNIKGTVAKLRGGTSFTENEEKLLDSYTPTINDSPLVIQSKLESLNSYIDLKRNNMISIGAGVIPQSQTTGSLEALFNQAIQ